MLAKTPKRRVVSGEELEGSLGKVSGRTVGLHSHHPLVVWTRSELVEGGKKPANQKRRITAGRERAVTETAVCPVPLAVPDSQWRAGRPRTLGPSEAAPDRVSPKPLAGVKCWAVGGRP